MIQQLLLVLIAMSSVYCEDCTTWQTLINNPALVNDLGGTFYKVIASGSNTSNVEACQKHTYTIGEDDNIVNGYLQSAVWCNQLTNCTATQYYHECDLAFLSVSPQPPSQKTKIKIVSKVVTSLTDYCLVCSYCRESEGGMSVLCTNQPAFSVTLLAQVTTILATLLGNILNVPPLFVSQDDCEFEGTCPP